MHVFNALLLAWLVALACKRKNGDDPLGLWRWIAAACGAGLAYGEVLFRLIGEGAWAQAYHGILWSIALQPFFAFILAGFLGVVSRKGWMAVFTPVVAGLAVTFVLGMLTEEGVAPLALLVEWRLGLNVLNSVDFVLMGLCVMGLVLARMFVAFDRDLARLALVAVLGYVLLVVWWGWQAHVFGRNYAEALGLDGAVVHALPQPISPQNWRVMVVEKGGRVHDTMINLGRSKELNVAENAGRAARINALYKPKEHAVWRIYRRFGSLKLDEGARGRVEAAWQAWRDGPFGWWGRFAVFKAFYSVPDVGEGVVCVGFKDLRFDGAKHFERGVFVVCPARGGGARVFRPADEEVDYLREWIPFTVGEKWR